MRRGRSAPPDGDAFAELEALYREVDARQSDHACPASTECCRFGLTGREPYVTRIELDLVLRAIARRGGRLPTKRPARLDTSPEASRGRTLKVLRDEGACPLLGPDGRCSAYAERPLGCRTFFCERATTPSAVPQSELNAWVRAVKDLGARHAPGGDEGRPLTRALAGDKRLGQGGSSPAKGPGRRG